jgi:hypothetical protein
MGCWVSCWIFDLASRINGRRGHDIDHNPRARCLVSGGFVEATSDFYRIKEKISLKNMCGYFMFDMDLVEEGMTRLRVLSL